MCCLVGGSSARDRPAGGEGCSDPSSPHRVRELAIRARKPDRPAITYALRSALGLELEVRGRQQDLHSGVLGGAIQHPLQVLCEMIARLHDSQGRVCIPGFYHRVRRWDAGERAYMRQMGPSDEQILRSAGATRAWGEHGYTLYARTTIRPAL